MSRFYKNNIRLKGTAVGKERRRNITKEPLSDSTPLPPPLRYEDIDKEFKRWVDEDLPISYEGERLQTISLFSNQRFSEYMQSWENVDDKRNLLLNFKTVNRENNPKDGSMIGDTRNIPGEHRILLKTVEAMDRNRTKYYLRYWMKQPFTVNLVYTVSVAVSKYELLNRFNEMMNDKFKAIECYIRPNGYFIPMKLTDISDESEYSIDNRQYYAQSYTVTVMAYIITEDDFSVEECPDFKFVGFEGINRSKAVVEDMPVCTDESDYAYVPVVITIIMDTCTNTYKFTMDCDFILDEYSTENARSFRLFINDREADMENEVRIHESDEVRVKGLYRFDTFKESRVILRGRNYSDYYYTGDVPPAVEVEYE